MQRRFGADFRDVRIHSDEHAATIARGLGARAWTFGGDVYFGEGEYAPSSDRGRDLLAHELAHTIQQGSSGLLPRALGVEQGMTGLVDVPEETPDPGEAEPAGEEKTLGIEEEEEETAGIEREDRGEAGSLEPMVQRSATWKGATVHESVNVANMVFGGSSPITWHLLNGTKLATTGDADGAIKVPGVTTSDAGGTWTAKVDTVPAQEGSGDETVVQPGPWTKVVTKVAAGAKTGLAACAGAGNSTFSALGKPSDDAVYKANRKHEDHHLSDHKAAFTDVIGRWDSKLQKAKDKGTGFKGPSEAAATGALWAAMGDTPKGAARSYRSKGFSKGAAYHATATGKPMSASNPASNADCSTSSVDVTNPA